MYYLSFVRFKIKHAVFLQVINVSVLKIDSKGKGIETLKETSYPFGLYHEWYFN